MRKSEVGYVWTGWSIETDSLHHLYPGITGNLCVSVCVPVLGVQ